MMYTMKKVDYFHFRLEERELPNPSLSFWGTTWERQPSVWDEGIPSGGASWPTITSSALLLASECLLAACLLNDAALLFMLTPPDRHCAADEAAAATTPPTKQL